MEGVRSQVYATLRSYWRRRSYRRLGRLPSAGKRKHVRVVRLGGGGSRSNRRSWRVHPMLRTSLRACSPIRLLARLRDAYVDAMLALAGGEARPLAAKKGAAGQDGTWGRRVPKARQMSGGRGDFERRMMVHIYRALVEPPEVIAV